MGVPSDRPSPRQIRADHRTLRVTTRSPPSAHARAILPALPLKSRSRARQRLGRRGHGRPGLVESRRIAPTRLATGRLAIRAIRDPTNSAGAGAPRPGRRPSDLERNPPALIRRVRVDANGRLRVHRHIRGAADPRAGARLQLSLIMSIAANAADRRRSEQVLNLAICQVAQATATPSRSRVHPSRRARCACVKLRRAAPVIARAIMALSGAGPGR